MQRSMFILYVINYVYQTIYHVNHFKTHAFTLIVFYSN